MPSVELLKTLILDAQTDVPFTGIRRRLAWERVSGKAFVCVGVRRCGKSTLLAQIMADLAAQGVPRENILYLNFFDERLIDLKRTELAKIMEAYFALYPHKQGKEKVYCFFDEIQEAQGWEPFVSRLLRTENCEIHLSGSSAKMLSHEIATQMRGRSLAWELFPFSFREFLDARKVAVTPMNSAARHLLQHHFAEYWAKGGFPEVLDMSDHLRVMTHQEYFKTVVERDVVDRHDALHPQAVRQLGRRLIGSVGSLFTVNRLTAGLQALGYKTSKAFVSECLQWFEDAYFLFSTKLFDRSINRQNVNPRKIYCVDHALAASVSAGLTEDNGHLLENLVFAHLRRETDRIFYLRTPGGGEVDLIWIASDRTRYAVQVCYSLRDPAVRTREIDALKDGMKALQLKEGWIVTAEEEELVKEAGFTIHIVPAWLYLAGLGWHN